MNWQAIGAIGEIVGAAAVLLTLVYLALQVRHATAAVRSSTTSDHHNLMVTLRLKLAENPELTDIYLRGIECDADLNGNELNRFDQIMAVVLHATEQASEFDRMGIVDDSVWHGQLGAIRFLASKPGFRGYWERWGYTFGGDFQLKMQKIVDDASDA